MLSIDNIETPETTIVYTVVHALNSYKGLIWPHYDEEFINHKCFETDQIILQTRLRIYRLKYEKPIVSLEAGMLKSPT